MSVEAPAVSTRPPRARNLVRRALLALGPGLVTGASDDDPSGIATYAQAGALLGFSTLWTALFTLPMMCVVQFMSAKIGMVSGDGFARVLREHYPRWLLYTVVFSLAVANTINAGVDLGAIAAAIHLLVPVSSVRLVIGVTIAILGVQVFGSYDLLARIFKWLTLALFAYIVAAFLAKPHWSDVLVATVRPTVRVDRQSLSILVAILGTTITPYLFFWQANQEVEEEIAIGRRSRRARIGASPSELAAAKLDVFAGMLLSNMVMFFVILATATSVQHSGITRIQSATDAAQALKPVAGAGASALWAVAIAAAGILTVPILTGAAAFAFSEAFAWTRGLEKRLGEATPFYSVIIVTTLVGMAINFAGINPIDALVWTAVINGFLAPPLLIVLLLVANNKQVLGDRVNGLFANIVGSLTTLIMCAAALALLFVAN